MKHARYALSFIDGSQEGWRNFMNNRKKPIRYTLLCFDVLLRGISQVVFMNNSISGLIIFIALCSTYWWPSVLGIFGLITTTSTAILFDLDQQSIKDGLHGYNGFVVGLALGTFADKQYFMIFPVIILCILCTVSIEYFFFIYFLFIFIRLFMLVG